MSNHIFKALQHKDDGIISQRFLGDFGKSAKAQAHFKGFLRQKRRIAILHKITIRAELLFAAIH